MSDQATSSQERNPLDIEPKSTTENVVSVVKDGASIIGSGALVVWLIYAAFHHLGWGILLIPVIFIFATIIGLLLAAHYEK